MTVSKLLNQLVSLGILREITGRARGRLFCYDEYVRLLGEGTEPIR